MNNRERVTDQTLRVRRPVSRRTLLGGGAVVLPLAVFGLAGGWKTFGRASGALAQESGGVSQPLPSCIVTPQQTEGPYFVDERLFRSDVRTDPSDGSVKEGAAFRLAFQIMNVTDGACTPLANVMVDVWHCDALGVYSDVQDRSFATIGQQFLRGSQLTDENGRVEFLTIYPGWYQGRTVHTHFKIRTNPDGQSGYEFTSQVYYDDVLTDQVHAQAPYAAKGQRTTRNSNDGIFRDGGEQLLLPIVAEGDGYAATMAIGVDLNAPASSGFGGPGGPGFPGGPPPRRP